MDGLAAFANEHGQRFHPEGPLLLYPVRTIWRKNVLEMGAIARLLPGANLITTDNSDWATNCPEYKVTAVQVVRVAQPAAWQLRRQAEASMPKRRKQPTEAPVGG